MHSKLRGWSISYQAWNVITYQDGNTLSGQCKKRNSRVARRCKKTWIRRLWSELCDDRTQDFMPGWVSTEVRLLDLLDCQLSEVTLESVTAELHTALTGREPPATSLALQLQECVKERKHILCSILHVETQVCIDSMHLGRYKSRGHSMWGCYH